MIGKSTDLKIWQNYFNHLKNEIREGTEFTFRTLFENLINSIKPAKNIRIITEPKRKKGFGAPDFKVEKDGGIIGYIETKNIGVNLDNELKSNSIKRYLSFIHNFILTNYQEFILIKNNVVVERGYLFYLKDLKKYRSKLKGENINSIFNIFHKFFITEPVKIGDSKELAVQLAERGKILKEYIFEVFRNNEKDNFSTKIKGLYEAFKNTLVEDLKKEEFADAFTQTLIYGIFLAYLNSNRRITLEDTHRQIPSSFKVIKEMFDIIKYQEITKETRWIYNEILSLINNINIEGLYESISFKDRKKGIIDRDPYLYFYENFLSEFDKNKRKSKGVYYTPLPVVSFIIKSIDKILLNKFNKERGFADSTVTVLDFAAGTGTFLVAIFELILDKIINSRGEFKSLVKDHLLPNFYGFEYLVAPYAVAHLKLSQLLKDSGYELENSNRINVYLTDTLDNVEHKSVPLLPVLTKEGNEANYIKTEKEILVITGNPPYNVKSRNKKVWISDLIKKYKPDDEKKLNLDDDYIKFIRYAQWKMENKEQGVIGIITNNSFLNGLTHRKMRETLLKDFDEIYILNLHGNSRIGEKTENEQVDENVFDIQQGVAISLFIKNKNNKDYKVFYCDLMGTRENKNDFLNSNDIDSVNWEELSINQFNNEFKKTKWGEKRFKNDLNFFVPFRNLNLIEEYGKFWGITEIFKIFGSGVKTDRDNLLIDFTENELEKKLKKAFSRNYDEEFRQKYNIWNSSSYNFNDRLKKQEFDKKNIKSYFYRPFDLRKVYYKVTFTSRPAYDVMKYIINNNNLGINFIRNDYGAREFNYFLISDEIIDLHLLGGQTYFAPLYIYDQSKNNYLYSDKLPNFRPEFQKFIGKNYSSIPEPEDILGYIYAYFYSNKYRQKYLEYLKIDFPRLPFVEDEKLFSKISNLGKELIEHHLLNKTYAGSKVVFPIEGNDSIEISKFRRKQDEILGKIYINKKQYFNNISENVWEFHIGGYQVLKKWLNERKNRKLLYRDKEHFKKVVNIIEFTLKQMDRIDNIIRDKI